jgi:ABC-type lipoprotein release transport system permease subunit
MMMVFFAGVLSGIAASIMFLIVYGYFMMRKLDLIKKNAIKELKSKLNEQDSKRASIIERLKQAQAITEQQLDIRSATDAPSKNALHSRYKNGLIGEIKKLEEEKIAILSSILSDGFDPGINVRDENGDLKEILLSDFLKLQSGSVPQTANDPDSKVPKQVGRFTVVKGGKDDGTVH